MKPQTKRILRNVPIIVIIVGVLLWVSLHFIHWGNVEYTDNAQVRRNIIPVVSRVQGYVKDVRFEDFQNVKKGDTLIVIENTEYLLKMNQSQAGFDKALSADEAMQTAINTAGNNLDVSDAALEELSIQLAQYEKDYKRYAQLLAQKAVTKQQYEHAKTQYESAQAKYDMLKRQKQSTQLQKQELTQKRGVNKSDIALADASKSLAELNLSYTVITAPCDGVVSKRNIQPGQLIQMGQSLLSVVEADEVWIIANYKETQMANIQEDMNVKVKVDAVPDVKYKARVEKIAKATGAQYSAIPQDNAAGNFIKIQQRIPVKIVFTSDNKAEDLQKLASGMNVECEVIYK